ncbi:MAG: copper-binding protein, partial [Acidimicrobiaceae bacterium]|nr:copper-binding protein [Acidimicrobiaceae bacterium]
VPTTTAAPTTTVASTTTTLPPLVEVVISGFSFGSPIQVSTGQTIRFTNLDGASHTATSGVFDSGHIGSGRFAEITLDTPGNYSYSCSYHPHMTGTIIVVDG